MFDELDLKIIDILKINSKIPLKVIGENIHLTPQGVSNRIIRIQDLGLITQYTICCNMDEINLLLDDILEYGTYRLNLSTSTIK